MQQLYILIYFLWFSPIHSLVSDRGVPYNREILLLFLIHNNLGWMLYSQSSSKWQWLFDVECNRTGADPAREDGVYKIIFQTNTILLLQTLFMYYAKHHYTLTPVDGDYWRSLWVSESVSHSIESFRNEALWRNEEWVIYSLIQPIRFMLYFFFYKKIDISVA